MATKKKSTKRDLTKPGLFRTIPKPPTLRFSRAVPAGKNPHDVVMHTTQGTIYRGLGGDGFQERRKPMPDGPEYNTDPVVQPRELRAPPSSPTQKQRAEAERAKVQSLKEARMKQIPTQAVPPVPKLYKR